MTDTPQTTRRPRVLLVDDHIAILRVTCRMLERLGHDVTVAERGAQAIEMFRSKAPPIDLIILDLGLPDMSGAEVLRAMPADWAAVPVIISSGAGANVVDQTLTDRRIAGRLDKPYSLQDLRTALEQASRWRAKYS
ncbi:MAG: response regulator [Myxococcales bacterium]|nr:response regulator [Myxococcales bacterium]